MALINQEDEYLKIISVRKDFARNGVFVEYKYYKTEEDRLREKEREANMSLFLSKVTGYRESQYQALMELTKETREKIEEKFASDPQKFEEEFFKLCSTEEKEAVNAFKILDEEVALLFQLPTQELNTEFKNKNKFIELGLKEEWLHPIIVLGGCELFMNDINSLNLEDLYISLKKYITNAKDA